MRPFDARWLEAVGTILTTLRAMQKPLTARNYTRAPYTFQKPSTEPKDTLAHGIGTMTLVTWAWNWNRVLIPRRFKLAMRG